MKSVSLVTVSFTIGISFICLNNDLNLLLIGSGYNDDKEYFLKNSLQFYETFDNSPQAVKVFMNTLFILGFSSQLINLLFYSKFNFRIEFFSFS